jgi:hypothetical protein
MPSVWNLLNNFEAISDGSFASLAIASCGTVPLLVNFRMDMIKAISITTVKPRHREKQISSHIIQHRNGR